jgi:hypothetical protein
MVENLNPGRDYRMGYAVKGSVSTTLSKNDKKIELDSLRE